MGTHQNNNTKTKKKSGPKKNNRLPWEPPETEAGDSDWGEINETLIADVVQAVCSHGGSIQFTTTRDRGALGVRVYDENMPKKTVWAHDPSEVATLLENIISHFSAQ